MLNSESDNSNLFTKNKLYVVDKYFFLIRIYLPIFGLLGISVYIYIYTLLGASIFADRSAVHAVLPTQAGGGGYDLDIRSDHCLVAGVQRAPGPDLLLQAGHH